MPVFVNNLQQKVKVDNRLLDILVTVVEASLKIEGIEGDPEVTLALVDDAYIRDLNFKFRNMDKPTDVLSFSMVESVEELSEEENILGDIIISMETAERQAEEYGHSLLREMAYLVTHGMFHLLGYDHDSEPNRQAMREREEKILALMSLSR